MVLDFSNGKLPEEILDGVWKYVRLMVVKRDKLAAVNKEFTHWFKPCEDITEIRVPMGKRGWECEYRRPVFPIDWWPFRPWNNNVRKRAKRAQALQRKYGSQF